MNKNTLQRKMLELAPTAHIGSYTSTEWASAIFIGERHQINLIFPTQPLLCKFVDDVPDLSLQDIELHNALLCDLMIEETIYDPVFSTTVTILTDNQ